MSNPFQDQLLKAGMVSKQQVQKANKDKHNKKKQKSPKNSLVVDEIKLAAQHAAKEKAALDRALNRKKEDDAKKRAVSAEINQIIENNRVVTGEGCELVYNFEHAGKVNRIYINNEIRQQIIHGKLGIASIDGRYELVPKAVAEKILRRDAGRVILFDESNPVAGEDDAYADYHVPDDLMW